jgi:predicted nucleic acid-binding protein
MGVTYLWDTNTVIYYMQQQFPPNAEQFIDSISQNDEPAISVITEIELLSWKSPTESDEKVLQNFTNDALIIELEQPIKLKTVEIRKLNKIKLPDAIIAATALVHNLTLVTRNVADFKNILALKIINPFEK